MPNSNFRNSRDDNSKKSRPSFKTERSDKKYPKQNDENYLSKRGYNDDQPSFGKQDQKPWKSKTPRTNDDSRGSGFSSSSARDKKPYGNKFSKDQKSFGEKNSFNKKSFSNKRPFESRSNDGASRPYGERKSFKGDQSFDRSEQAKRPRFNERYKAPLTSRFKKEPEDDGLIRLNRYIANAGICSRRKADELIEAGVITVNGQVVTELGTKVDVIKDEIRYNGEKLKREKMVYVLLNKPKDYITTTDDPQERRTVMQLVAKATRERIYPVGRLDRNTTGLLLLTNDGNLAEKLSHPRNSIAKIYQVELNKNLQQGDFNKIAFGLELEDGFIKPDDISYIQGASKREVGIQIHSGKNRIVRRIFEALGYEVVKLDRVVYANLTKKDLPRGRWRYLEEKEIIQIKHLIK